MFATQSLDNVLIKKKEFQKINEIAFANSWSLSEKIVIACRILAQMGHCTSMSGQISARYQCDQFLTQAVGQGFDEISVSSILQVNYDLDLIQGEGCPNPANRFHSWLYNERDDVDCIIHMHSKFASIVAMLNCEIEIAHMDTTCLYDEIAYLKYWPGIPLGNDEGHLISESLGQKKALLLANHGYIIAAKSVEECLYLALRFELACELFYRAKQLGEISPIEPELALEAKKWTTMDKRFQAHFQYCARKILRDEPTCLD